MTKPKECEYILTRNSRPCNCCNLARKGKKYCWMHDGTPKKTRRLLEKIKQLKTDLLKFGGHQPNCLDGPKLIPVLSDECTCGWEKVKKQLESDTDDKATETTKDIPGS